MFPDETTGLADQCLRKAEIEPEDLLNALAALLDNRRKQTISFACNQAAL